MKCHKCGASMAERSGKFGDFWGCETFPRCRGSAPMNREPSEAPSGALSEQVERLMRDGSAPDGGYSDAFHSLHAITEARLGRRVNYIMEALDPDDADFESVMGYTPGDQ